jgi:hypothetical protein
VHDIGGMHEVERAQQVINDLNNMNFFQRNLWNRAKYFFHVSLHIFHDNKQVVKCHGVFRDDYVVDFNGEMIILHLSEMTHNLDFSDDFLRIVNIFKQPS